jgi:uncharacterized protein (TIGR03067 family)
MNPVQGMALILAALATAVAQNEGRGTKERKGLQGTWVVVSANVDGKPDDSSKGVRFTFTDQAVTVDREGKRSAPVVFRVDPTKSPKQIDFEERRPPTAGIYELDGDRLRLCYGVERTSEFRPETGYASWS